MPTIFTHSMVGLSAALVCSSYEREMPPKFSQFQKPLLWKEQKAFWILSFLLPMIPDLDALSLYLGIPYGHLFGHRGFSHSILFALILGYISTFFLSLQGVKERGKLAMFFFWITLSHSLLDGFTNGGLGVAYFSPFDLKRYFFPFRPIEVAPLSWDIFFSKRGVEVMASEIFWVWLPTLFFTFLFYKRRKT